MMKFRVFSVFSGKEKLNHRGRVASITNCAAPLSGGYMPCA